MRITAGKFKGRVLDVPKGQDVRPTTDKVRQAIYNMLLPYGLPENAQVLDVFCGTGALGLEALSRGADFCTFIDSSAQSLNYCQRNIAAIKSEAQTKTRKIDCRHIPKRPLSFLPATLVFIDPPYRQNLAFHAMRDLLKQGWFAPGAICVVETEKQADLYVPDILRLLKLKNYGDTQIALFQYGSAP